MMQESAQLGVEYSVIFVVASHLGVNVQASSCCRQPAECVQSIQIVEQNKFAGLLQWIWKMAHLPCTLFVLILRMKGGL